MFEPVTYNFAKSFSKIHNLSDGIYDDDVEYYKERYGTCTMNLEIRPWHEVLVLEVLNLYHFFTSLAVVIWLTNNFFRTAGIIGLLIALALYTELTDILTNLQRLQEMAYYETKVKVKRRDPETNESTIKEISSDDLVPGDIMLVPDNDHMPCDAILLNGEAIVNESMLTGESIPAFKPCLPKDNDKIVGAFNIENKDQSRYFLFWGTFVEQTKKPGDEGVIALVVRTGFSTTKGVLVKSIMYSGPSRNDFYHQVYKILVATITIGLISWLTVLPTYIQFFKPFRVITRDISPMTLAVPAILPVVMIIGIQYSLYKLRQDGIYCITPLKINTAGRVSILVFDKTGTLTIEGLEAVGYKVVNQKDFQDTLKDPDKLVEDNEIWKDRSKYQDVMDDPNVKFLEWMAWWHSVNNLNDKLIGDPLETEMFDKTNFVIDDNENRNLYVTHQKDENEEIDDNIKYSLSVYPSQLQEIIEKHDEYIDDYYQLKLIKRLEFSSELQRMSALVYNIYADKYMVYTKGSPEKIATLCDKNSIPDNYNDMLQKYTNNGYRIIALAYRYADTNNYQTFKNFRRSALEKNLKFWGFLIFANKLKEKTKGSIKELQNADIDTIMATGDNILTAISVAQKWHIMKNDEYFVIETSKDDDSMITVK